jgi:hypothetical protein
MNMQSSSVSSSTPATYPPNSDDVPVTSDPGSALLTHILMSRGALSDNAREDVNRANAALEEARRQMREALERARKAEEKSGFWGAVSNVFSGDLAAVAEVVASAAAVVATGGAGAAGVLALVSAGMSIGADVGERAGLDPKICAVLAAGGAITGVAVGQFGVSEGAWAELAKGARVANGAATAAGTGARAAAGAFHADALDAGADAQRARDAQGDAMFRFNAALEVLQKCARDVQRADSAVGSLIEDQADGKSALIARMRAA